MAKKGKEHDEEQDEVAEQDQGKGLEARVDALEDQVADLEERVSALEQQGHEVQPTRDTHPELFDEFGNFKG